MTEQNMLLRRRGIRWKILTSNFILVVILTFIFNCIMAYFMSSLTNEVLRETLIPMAKSASQNISSGLHLMADRIFLTLDDTVFDEEASTLEEKQAVLDRAQSSVEFRWIGIYGTDGRLQTGSPESPETIGDRRILALMRETNNLVISDTEESEVGPEVVVGTPILDGTGVVTGYMVGSYDYGVMFDSLVSINPGANGSVFVINQEGVYMAARDLTLVENAKNIRDVYGDSDGVQGLLKEANQGGTGMVRTAESIVNIFSGQLFSYAPIPGTLWTLIIETPKRDYMDPVIQAIYICVLVALLLLPVAAAYTTVLSGRILRPLGKITDRIIRLAQGDFHSEVEIAETKDETEALSVALQNTVRDISSYTEELSVVLTRLSQSNLNTEVEGQFQGDFVAMKDSINNTVRFLNDFVRSIQKMSAQVLSSANLVSDTAHKLQQSTDLQAGAISRLNDETGIISANVADVNDNTIKAVDRIQAMMEQLGKAEVYTKDMLAAIRVITDNADEVTKVNKFLEDISFQTNILALNAAVEASRAGNAGRGFAVVADEVRKLATESSEASRRTREIVEDAMQSMEGGSVYGNRTAESIREVSSLASDLVEITNHLNHAVEAQGASLTNVTGQINEINKQATENLNFSRENATVGTTLANQANEMQEVLDRFRLRKAETAPGDWRATEEAGGLPLGPSGPGLTGGLDGPDETIAAARLAGADGGGGPAAESSGRGRVLPPGGLMGEFMGEPNLKDFFEDDKGDKYESES